MIPKTIPVYIPGTEEERQRKRTEIAEEANSRGLSMAQLLLQCYEIVMQARRNMKKS